MNNNYSLDDALKGSPIDTDLHRYFQEYSRRYYSDSFQKGLGTEDILEAIEDFHRPGSWIDLGAGTTSLLWAITARSVDSIVCVDSSKEALVILRNLWAVSENVPNCYLEACDIFKINRNIFTSLRRIKPDYRVFDALRPWPVFEESKFDTITQIGLFGLTSSEADFYAALKEAVKRMNEKSVFIGANWIFRQGTSLSNTHDNSFITPDFIQRVSKLLQLKLLRLKRVLLENDPFYSAVILFVVTKK